jgi:hypothetical protein
MASKGETPGDRIGDGSLSKYGWNNNILLFQILIWVYMEVLTFLRRKRPKSGRRTSSPLVNPRDRSFFFNSHILRDRKKTQCGGLPLRRPTIH